VYAGLKLLVYAGLKLLVYAGLKLLVYGALSSQYGRSAYPDGAVYTGEIGHFPSLR